MEFFFWRQGDTIHNPLANMYLYHNPCPNPFHILVQPEVHSSDARCTHHKMVNHKRTYLGSLAADMLIIWQHM